MYLTGLTGSCVNREGVRLVELGEDGLLPRLLFLISCAFLLSLTANLEIAPKPANPPD